MAFPKYEEIEKPLLCLIFHSGGDKHEIQANETYQPLADCFKLSASEKTELRNDGRDEPLWNNMVQWARRKLNDQGYLASAPRGIWRLSESGIAAAKRQCT